MISRYDVKEISHIWSDHHRLETYLKVELAVLKAFGREIPAKAYKEICQKAKVDVQRIEEIEQSTKHDVIAFCTSITENLSPEVGKYFHYGVTSSDIIDTSLMLLIKESSVFVLKALGELKTALWKKANEYKGLMAMGRSHGIYAEPLSFGQKFLSFYREICRREQDLKQIYSRELTGKISGAVGNYTIVTRKVEQKALELLGLYREELSTQIIPRDRIAKIILAHGLLASGIERIAVEIRHLHRSEVAEACEGLSEGQKGSSTMPHKKNPISAENLTGMSRLLRSHVPMALENCVLWHERDISHSCVERVYLPDNFGLLVYSLRRLSSTIVDLVIDEKAVGQRVTKNFIYLSSYYLHYLIRHLEISRPQCYDIVQKAAFSATSAEDFHRLIIQKTSQQGLTLALPPIPTEKELEKLYLKEVDSLFSSP